MVRGKRHAPFLRRDAGKRAGTADEALSLYYRGRQALFDMAHQRVPAGLRQGDGQQLAVQLHAPGLDPAMPPGDKGLRTSKLQYLPAFLGAKIRVLARNELGALETVPMLKTERLTLDALREEDKVPYNRLCLDDARNPFPANSGRIRHPSSAPPL